MKNYVNLIVIIKYEFIDVKGLNEAQSDKHSIPVKLAGNG